ncbi:MAG: hypothetical protein Q9167_003948 [Letrouitia subvulpina]
MAESTCSDESNIDEALLNSPIIPLRSVFSPFSTVSVESNDFMSRGCFLPLLDTPVYGPEASTMPQHAEKRKPPKRPRMDDDDSASAETTPMHSSHRTKRSKTIGQVKDPDIHSLSQQNNTVLSELIRDCIGWLEDLKSKLARLEQALSQKI